MGGLGRKQRKDAKAVLHIIDSTPVPLGHMFDCAAFNGRIRGLKLHVLHDLDGTCPLTAGITPASTSRRQSTHPVQIPDQIPIRSLSTMHKFPRTVVRKFVDRVWH